MASSIFYKFRSQKDESRITFDGTGISVFDLKREIIIANGLSKANDFDLVALDGSGKEFKDDSEIIPRSSSVIVKRVPAKPGRGAVAVYLGNATPSDGTSKPGAGPGGGGSWYKGTMSKRFDGKEEVKQAAPAPITLTGTTEDEAAAMAAMFQAEKSNWEETQEKMSHAQRINMPRGGASFARGGKPHVSNTHQTYQTERPLPPAYVCYRCGQKGHWIQDCPTNNDREYDNRPRIKRTTGIPRSFLKTVENAKNGQVAQGVMITPEGGLVVAQPDTVSWKKQVTRSSKGLTAEDVRERAPADSQLACPIDNKLFRDAVKTPCCGTTYCEECIQTHLLERDFTCPNCGKRVPSLDKLVMDKPMRTRVADYIDKAIEESKNDDESTTAAAESTNDPSKQESSTNSDQELYSEQQPGGNDIQMLIDSIPHLQAQIAQISAMLQNSSLPLHVRQTAEAQHQQLQMQLMQAQTLAGMLSAQAQMQTQGMAGGMPDFDFGAASATGNWPAQPLQNPVIQDTSDGAYQRLPVNNRRRNLKRDRPSEFLEIAEGGNKVSRFME